MFADFQSQRLGEQNWAPREPSYLESVSRARFLLQIGGLVALMENFTKNECTKRNSRPPAREEDEVLARHRPVPIDQHPSSDMACTEELLALVQEASRLGETAWINRGQCVLRRESREAKG